MTRSIALLGMMGVGKTTVAGLLAGRLGREAVETDDLIEARAGRAIPDIFADDGEAAFRALERDVVAEVSGRADLVIGLGGGAVLDDRNVEVLREQAVLVQLRAPVEVLVPRLADETMGRPLLFGTDLALTLAALVEARGARYDEVADHTVDATAEPTEVAAAILAWAAARDDVLADRERARIEVGA